jgi:hypothetical protein
MTARADALNAVLGRPWLANAKGPDAFDCWHLTAHIQAVIFGRILPTVSVPAAASWAWMIAAIESHPERQNWRFVPADRMGLVKAGDGAVVLMARYDRPAHIGTWLKAEGRVIHADARLGVVCEPLVELRTKGWTKLRFYEPI